MHSDLPKVLHRISGRPMLDYVLDAAQAVESSLIHVVHGHGGELLMKHFSNRPVNWVYQAEQLGTGHAVAQAAPALEDDSVVLVLSGDVPLIRPKTLQALVSLARQGQLALLTIALNNPAELGRIIRNPQQQIVDIREFKDASETERQIKEINTGVLAVPASYLKRWLSQLDNNNAQQEYYLTDIVKRAVADHTPVVSITADAELEVSGVNSKLELVELERAQLLERAKACLKNGLMISDPARFDLQGTLNFGRDCRIAANVIMEGECTLGDHVEIGAHCIIRNTTIADNTTIEPYTLIDNAQIGKHCCVGPYARLRPGTVLRQGSKIGNFVEVKNAVIGEDSKANHLSYIGDAHVGRNTNIGAGVITCNYDGAKKHKTIIGDNVQVGSDCQLVAPVTLHDNATIGAGTTVYKDAPAGVLTINKKDQVACPDWQRPDKNET